MRTSKLSQETTKIFKGSQSPNQVRRSTRQAAKTISTFALGRHGDAGAIPQMDGEEQEGTSYESDREPASAAADIEDGLTGQRPASTSRKRKRATTPVVSQTTTNTALAEKEGDTRKGPDLQYTEDETLHSNSKNNNNKRSGGSSSSTTEAGAEKGRKNLTARKETLPDGTVKIHPPSNWERVYELVKQMRRSNPTAPVDTMGCESLFWPTSPPDQQRYHTLIALMLSSQTKDTVTAAAMQRLHTELGPDSPPPSREEGEEPKEKKDASKQRSSLTIPTILSTPPSRLNSLIHQVGFHNTKTRHIVQTTCLLQRDHNSDVPRDLATLLTLPGVGPKMALLALSACWNISAGIGVDVHVHRITNLWRWHPVQTKGPEETRSWLQAWLPVDRWHEINGLLVGLGQTVCLPGSGGGRRRCGECVLGGTGLCAGEVRLWQDERSS